MVQKLGYQPCHYDSNVTIHYQNVRGLRSKMNAFYLNSFNFTAQVIALTETWLKSDNLNTELFSNEYVVFRCDRQSRAGVS